MKRLYILTEGQTEQKFVNKLLSIHLGPFGVSATAMSVRTSRDRHTKKIHRGGMTSYEKAKNDIMSWLKEHKGPNCRFSTMFDLYALPNNFPGFEASEKLTPYDRTTHLEAALQKDIGDSRFSPYIQIHEFESLILAAPEALALIYPDQTDQIKKLIAMVGKQNPELINGKPETAPSKRITGIIRGYDKTVAGIDVIAEIGIDRLKERCLHFGEWVSALEMIGTTP